MKFLPWRYAMTNAAALLLASSSSAAVAERTKGAGDLVLLLGGPPLSPPMLMLQKKDWRFVSDNAERLVSVDIEHADNAGHSAPTIEAPGAVTDNFLRHRAEASKLHQQQQAPEPASATADAELDDETLAAAAEVAQSMRAERIALKERSRSRNFSTAGGQPSPAESPQTPQTPPTEAPPTEALSEAPTEAAPTAVPDDESSGAEIQLDEQEDE